MMAPSQLADAGHALPGAVLTAWSFDPAILVPLVATGWAYGTAVRRVWRVRGRAAFPVARVGCFGAGLFVLFLALQSPIDDYAGLLLSVHMGQHLLLTMVAAPLLVLGTPVTLALEMASKSVRRRFLVPVLHARATRALSAPAVAWVLFAAVMWGAHLRPVYEAALGSDGVHALEHGAFLGSALLFWWPVVGLDPGNARLSYPGRLLYLFLAMPVTAVLGLAMYGADRLLYPAYGPLSASVGASAVADQHLAGAIMWEGGMLLMLPALAFVLLDWMRRDERDAARADARRLST